MDNLRHYRWNARSVRMGLSRLALALGLVIFLMSAFPQASSAASPSERSGRWISVNLTKLHATAWEGDTPLYTAKITAGKGGWETPTGAFYIFKRVYNETMDSRTIGIPRNGPGGYYLEDVMYSQYFEGSGMAIHGNYWQPGSVFGNQNTSHGCIGMSNSDAAYFWDFAEYGTPVVIYY